MNRDIFYRFLERFTDEDRFRMAAAEARHYLPSCPYVTAIKDASIPQGFAMRFSALWFDVTQFTSGERFSVTYSTRSKVKRTGRREGTPGVVAGEIDGH